MLDKPFGEAEKRIIEQAVSLVLATRPEGHQEQMHGIYFRSFYQSHNPFPNKFTQSNEFRVGSVTWLDSDELFVRLSKEKADRLSTNSHQHFASSQSRNRDNQQYGGAIFADEDKNSMMSLSGLSDSRDEEEAALFVASVLLHERSLGSAYAYALYLKNRLLFQLAPALYDVLTTVRSKGTR